MMFVYSDPTALAVTHVRNLGQVGLIRQTKARVLGRCHTTGVPPGNPTQPGPRRQTPHPTMPCPMPCPQHLVWTETTTARNLNTLDHVRPRGLGQEHMNAVLKISHLC